MRTVCLLCLTTTLVLGDAASAGTPPMDSNRPRVLLVGDSNMFGPLGHALTRSLREMGFEVYRRGKPSSGLAFPHFYDWNDVTPTLAQQKASDIVIMCLGGNDGQAMKPRPGDGWRGKIAWEDEHRWRAEYRDRLMALATSVVEQGRRFVLLSPTNRRPPSEREKMGRILDLQSSTLAGLPNTHWIDLFALTSAPDGRYRAAGHDARGKWVLYRRGDGIHLTKEGAADLLDRLLPRLVRGPLSDFPNVAP